MANKKPRPIRFAIHRKILQFFAENQSSIDTPRGVSVWVNEGLEIVRTALEDLVAMGYLRAHRTSSTVAYSCALDTRELAKVARRQKK